MNNDQVERKKVFVSYSWDSEDHRRWVKKLSDELEEYEDFHVLWDGYDLDSLIDKNHFMESGIFSSEFVIVVTTQNYKRKADERLGGVGIETYMATASHWDLLLSNKKTKFINIMREKGSIPNYLAGHFYIDFSDDSFYQDSMIALVAHLKGEDKFSRPQKKKTTSAKEKLYSFTKVEDLIKLKYKNRNAIVNSEGGTNFSGANRIKYELWETRSPALGYFLTLASNINISQTVSDAIEKLSLKRIRPQELTVLRPKAGRSDKNLILRLFESAGFRIKIHEFTYKDYFWDYCVDEKLKQADPPSVVPNYTDQTLLINNGEFVETNNSALDYFATLLQADSHATAHLIVAPGGMGKTSLCLSIASNLHNQENLRSSVILIQAETIKYFSDQGANFSRIDSIYQLYELYARFYGYDQFFDRATFDLAVLCGNVVVIIDGLDEFTSLFQDKFNLDSFLESLGTLHKQLGSSRILITTRNNLLIDDIKLKELDILKYDLLGFDAKACEKYIARRFRGYEDHARVVEKVLAQIAKVSLHDHEKRVVPFFADIASTVFEDALRDQQNDDFEIEEESTPYPSNNDLTDHIIHSVLRREEKRHGLDISVKEVIDIFSSLVVDYGIKWPSGEMKERIEMLYDSRANNIFSKISLSPLLIAGAENIELRYDFLSSYFELLLILNGIVEGSVGNEFIKSLGRLTHEREEFRETKRYFSEKKEELHASVKIILSRLKHDAVSSNASSSNERERSRRGIASLLNIYSAVVGKTMADLKGSILEIYGISSQADENVTLDGLFIFGGFPAFDFSNMTVTNSRFYKYNRFLASRFRSSKFLYCSFEACSNSEITNTTLEHSMIDPSCDMGDLRESLDLSKSNRQEETKMVHSEVTKFLHCFFKGDRFIENNPIHIRFSNKVPGISKNKINRLISNGYLKVKREKEIDTFYEIPEHFRSSVRNFLVNNYLDATMKKFIAFVRQ